MRQLARFMRSTQIVGASGHGGFTGVFGWTVHQQNREKSTSSNRKISCFKRFIGGLLQSNLRADDPTAGLMLAKPTARLPKNLSEAQVEALLAAPDAADLGVRNRAMLELMYASGLRVSELVGLRMLDVVKRRRGTRDERGNKPAWCRLAKRGGQTLKQYLDTAARRAARTLDAMGCFVTARGGAMTRQDVWHVIKNMRCRRAFLPV